MKTSKKNAWLPLAEEKGYKKGFLIRKQQDKEAQEEIDEYILPDEEEFPVNDKPGSVE